MFARVYIHTMENTQLKKSSKSILFLRRENSTTMQPHMKMCSNEWRFFLDQSQFDATNSFRVIRNIEGRSRPKMRDKSWRH